VRVRVYEVGGGARVGARVAYVVGGELGRVDGLALARRLGAPLTVLECDPRRDDCARRLRVFTPTRELPLSVEAAWCAAEARRGAVTVEIGVTATAVRPDGEAWVAALPTPVLGQRAVDDRALVAAALGLDGAELDGARPVLAGSCGVNVLVVPVAGRAALERARLHPDAWHRVMEKAKHVGALLVAAEGGGREARFVGSPSGLWDGTGCALSLAPWALAQSREGALGRTARYALRGEAGFGVEVDVTCDAAEGWSMRGAAGLVSDGLVVT
jgi:hypothetical protein